MSTTEAAPVLAAARAAYAAGICVVPPREDGSKRPVEAWAKYQAERPGVEQMRAWYGPHGGLGFVCGRVSGDLELFEFDDGATYEAFKAAAAAVGLRDLVARVEAGYLELTPGGGVHWFYRCEEIAGNTTLARRPAGTGAKTLIQTRGEGGYAVVAPSNGRVHPTGRPYCLVTGGAGSIARITAEEREALWALGRSFDEVPRPEFAPPRAAAGGGWLERPGDDFARRASWTDVLEPHGWRAVHTRGHETFWRRPGKERGWSATTNYGGFDLLYVFTSSSQFDAERGYGKFAAYAILGHGGDFKAAAAALADKGYGKPAPQTDVRVDETTGEEVVDYHLTDLGNSLRLVVRHGPEIRWCKEWNRWLSWRGSVWDGDGTTAVQERAKETALSIYEESIASPSNERAEALRKWAKSSESARSIAAMMTLARSDAAVQIEAEQLDADPYLFNVANGTLELRSWAFREHRREDLLTKRSPVTYDPEAVCPRWLAYLERVFGGDAEVIGFVQRAVGYSLTGSTGERVMFILHGTGHNGKTTFIEVIAHILGNYAMSTPVETLIAKKDRGIPNDVARLKSARFVSATETEQGDKLAEAFVKAVTGGDRVSARFLHAEWFEFTPQLKLWLATNHRPQISGTDPAIWDRIRLIPFEVEIPEAERDRDLKRKLMAEAPGILSWALEGCRLWQESGLVEPKSIRDATSQYRSDEDVLGAWIEDCCEVLPPKWESHSDLYDSFKAWAKRHGEEEISAKAFSQRMVERRGIRKSRQGGARTRGYLGLHLLGRRQRQEDGLGE